MQAYRVKKWTDEGAFHNYYFVGGLQDRPEIRARVLSGQHTEADIAAVLGDSFAPELPCSFVAEEIFFDDNASAVAGKVIRNICPSCTPGDVYMWVETEIEDRMSFANDLAKNMMRSSRSITGKEITNMISRVIDYDVDFPEQILYERIRHRDLYDILHGSTMTSYLQRLAFEYNTEIEYKYIFNVNPLRADVHDLTDAPKIFTSTSSHILHDYLPVGNVINVMLKDDFARHIESTQLVDLYFPPNVNSTNMVVETGDDALYSRVLREIEQFREKSYYKKVFVSIYPIGPLVNTKLSTIFQNFSLDSVCPLSKYRAHGNVVYKVDLQAVSGVQPATVALWTKEVNTMGKSSSKESIVFKVYYGDFFVTLVLFPMLIYHVKLTFKSAQVESLDYVSDQVLPFVNHVLGKVRDMVSVEAATHNLLIPLLSKDMINKHNILEVHTVSFQSFNKKLPSVSQIEQRFSALGGVFFRVTNQFGVDGNNVVTFKYTRSSGYSPVLDIKAFVRSQISRVTKRELVDTVVESFHVTRETADTIYEDTLNNQEETVHMRSYEGLLIKLVRKNDYELTCNVKGAKIDSVVASHISSLVKAILVADYAEVARAQALVPPKDKEPARNKAPAAIVADTFDPTALIGDDQMLNQDGIDHKYEADLSEDVEEEEEEGRASKSNSEPEDADADQASAESTGGFDVKKYILRRLKRADNDLFVFDAKNQNYKSYASLCASNAKRQPIVVDDAKLKDMMAKYPGAVPNYVKAGSTAEKAGQNAYICPKIWCTHSEVAMTPKQFRDAGGCPSADDKVLKLYRKGQEAKPKFTSFLDPSRHPKELCVPCCFFVDHENKISGKLKKRFAKCRGDNEVATSDVYIKGLVFPLEAGRYGRLPYTLARYLGCSECHKRPKDENCFVRKGIHHNSQFFLSCMATVMAIDGVQSAPDLVAHIATNLQPGEFVRLNNGNMLRVFVDNTISVLDPDYYHDFRMWLLDRGAYVSEFGLEHLAEAVDAHVDPSGLKPQLVPELQREFMVYAAMNNFFNYLRSDMPKDHRALLELFASDRQWMNPGGVNVLLVEDDGENKVFSVCPYYANAKELVSTEKKCVLVLKYQQFYEPVFEVRQIGSGFTERREFGLPEYPLLRNIYQFYLSSCKALANDRDGAVPLGPNVASQVVNAGYRAVGVMNRAGLFVPYPREQPMAPGIPSVHVNRVDKHVTPASVASALRVLHEVSDDAFYKDATAHQNGIGVLMGDGETYVPVGSGDHGEWMHVHDVGLHIFTDVQLSNKSFDYIEQWNMKQATYQGFKRSVVITILSDPELKKEFDFIRFEHNPFPRETRIGHMLKLIGKAAPGPNVFSPEESARIADALLFQDLGLLTHVEYKQRAGVVFLTQQQIDAGELTAMMQSMEPYKKYAKGVEDIAGIGAASG